MGGLPYAKKLVDNWASTVWAYVDHPRITEIISPKCSAKASLPPLAVDVTASGLQVVVQLDVKVHISVIGIPHTVYPTTFATMTLPGTFKAAVTQPQGLASLKVSQSFQEWTVDARWDSMVGAPLNNSTD